MPGSGTVVLLLWCLLLSPVVQTSNPNPNPKLAPPSANHTGTYHNSGTPDRGHSESLVAETAALSLSQFTAALPLN